jgi:hypothetical protein
MLPQSARSVPALARPRTIPITNQRSLVLDIAHFARRVPVFPVERTFDLAALAAARAAAQPRIAWSVLFMKAQALVAARRPELRQGYFGWPWPRIVEWPTSVGTIVVSREDEGQERLCWARFSQPENHALTELNGHLWWYRHRPLEQTFKSQLQFSRLPMPLRRCIWWWMLNVAGAKRAHRFGTFSISSLASEKSLNRGHPSLLTTSLTYGPLDDRGNCLITMLCDHRILNGIAAARALADLEATLNGEILSELSTLAHARAA